LPWIFVDTNSCIIEHLIERKPEPIFGLSPL